MQVTIIANGFQEDYIHNLVRSISSHVGKIEVIGSDIYCFDNFPANVHVLNLRGNHDDRVSVILKSFRILSYYFKLIKYLIGSRSSVIHVQWLRFEIVEGIFFSLFIRLLGKQVIYTAHNILPHNKKGWFLDFKFRIIYSVQNKIIVHTAYIKSQLCNKFNLPVNKIHSIPHGVYEPLSNPSIDQEIAKRNLNLPSGKSIALFFGRFSVYKGFDIIVDAVKDMKYKNEIIFLVAGRVIDHYQNEFDRIRKMSSAFNFKYILKHVTDEEMELCFKAADFCIIPYREASQSGVLFMSYAYGTPVIVSRIGGFTEDVIEGKTGFLFEAGDAGSLSEKLDYAILTNKTGELFSRNELISYAVQNYSWDITAKKLVNIYNNSIN